ncbi:MAG: hypothetical protein KF729_31650 [Sandaracinaceae bacterium]|nr:hypothetical protein [Sandaracinaceae bacterium]
MRWEPSRAVWIALCLAAVFGARASITRADAVPADYEPPRCAVPACPPGTHPYGVVGHGTCGEGCTLPRECGDPERCGPESECRETRLCVVPQLVQGRVIADTVFGECGADGACARGECVVARRCASTRPPPAPRPAGEPLPTELGCGACAIHARRGPSAALIALAAWALAWAARRGHRRVAARRSS